MSPDINPASYASEYLHNDDCHGLENGKNLALETEQASEETLITITRLF